MAITHLASAMLLSSSTSQNGEGGRQAWGRPTVCALPNGNTFVAVWYLGDGTAIPYGEAYCTLRLWLLDPDLNVLHFMDVKGSNDELATVSSGLRPIAYRVEDHTVWLMAIGNSGSNEVNHNRMWMINAKGTTLTIINEWDMTDDLLINALYYNVEGNPPVVYLSEANMVVICAGDIFVIKNGSILSRLTSTEFNGYFGYGVPVFRNPDDPTKFGIINADSGGGIATVVHYEYTVDPVTGIVTEQSFDHYYGAEVDDPDWYFWQQTSSSPYTSESFVLNSTDWSPYLSQVFEVVNTRTLERQGVEFEIYEETYGYTGLFDDSPSIAMGTGTGGQMAWVYTSAPTGTMNIMLRCAYVDSNVSPPRYEWIGIPMPFQTHGGDYNWDTFSEGNSAVDWYDEDAVFASGVLDDSIYGTRPGGGTAYYSALVVIKVRMGEKSPPRLVKEELYERGIGGMPAGGGRLNVKTQDGWHHEWSTEDDEEDFTKLRYPLRLKTAEDRWTVVGMFTPDP